MVKVLLLISFSFYAIGIALAQNPLVPGELAIYYGFPSLVNGSEEDLNAATEVFNDYNLVVFGDGLQDPTHSDHTNTATIISNLKTLPNNTKVYGYIPLGVTMNNLLSAKFQSRLDTWAAMGVAEISRIQTVNLSIADIQSRVDAWIAMGVAGIFLDEAGYDFGVSRQRQNDAIDYVHSKGLGVFINAFDPDDVFSPTIEPGFNPAGDPTSLGANDIYLHESFQIILSEYQDPSFWVNKSDKALTYKELFGTRMATVTTVSGSHPVFDQSKFDYAWWSTLLYGFDIVGWGELFFSALDSNLPFRSRPNPEQIGDDFTSLVNHVNAFIHTRTTAIGTIEVDTDIHSGRFLQNGILFSVERASGNIFAQGSFIVSGADLAERINVSERVEFGDVVELDPKKPGYYRKTNGHSRLFAGIISTKPGFTLGNRVEQVERVTLISGEETLTVEANESMLALIGRVPVKATNENGPINAGDLLTISNRPGYAARCAEAKLCEGEIIGKALEGLDSGEGMILMLVMSH